MHTDFYLTGWTHDLWIIEKKYSSQLSSGPLSLVEIYHFSLYWCYRRLPWISAPLEQCLLFMWNALMRENYEEQFKEFTDIQAFDRILIVPRFHCIYVTSPAWLEPWKQLHLFTFICIYMTVMMTFKYQRMNSKSYIFHAKIWKHCGKRLLSTYSDYTINSIKLYHCYTPMAVVIDNYIPR